MKTVLTIAGYDPSSGAGVTADLMVFAAHGLFGTSCITALTVQSTLGVQSVHPVGAGIVADTLRCLDQDLRPSGVKIGMVANGTKCLEIESYISSLNVSDAHLGKGSRIPIVLDPVISASSGVELVDSTGLDGLRERLMPLVDWITPNLEELALLTGKAVESCDDLPSACHLLQQLAENPGDSHRLGILAKGGHLDKPDDYLLTPEGVGHWLRGSRVETTATHGTGCALSSSFLSHLVLGEEPLEAATRAKAYVSGALREGRPIGRGAGPVNHLWNYRR